ncbi:serine protease [Pseudodesulfovibrio sp. F-1]|uniref:Serine protease n=1 Tax=Pseudodesulfovibrio alkaliphilus TaxID=2661613 RepID=A0A7K1KLK0_9BACT|nr:patatin-like phospholipase family protein [Pseudodesulfovibrio alkaliphilus]MUM76831.1 serine protease [Pseudodesulfovibrio alkaliphilus]
MTKKTTVSLVLGSGGARGLAHIGVIRWLQANGCDIRSISGSSMGALVGGIHAIGKLDEYEVWARKITKASMLSLLDFSMGTAGLFKGAKLIETLKSLVGNVRIEQLSVSYTAVASNISQAKEVWFRKGPIFDAIRASISLPLIFTPFRHEGADLIDGGILNPVPIAPTFSDNTDVTIAVNLCGRPVKGARLPDRDDDRHSLLPGMVSDLVDKFRNGVGGGINIGAYDVLSQSFDAMQGTIARQKIAVYPPDHLIEIPRNLCRLIDFDRAEELINHGYEAARQRLSGVLPLR